MFKAPVIYFPSTVIFLDDDSLYARLLIHRLLINNLRHIKSANILLKQQNSDLLFIDDEENNSKKNISIEYLKKNINHIKTKGKMISVIISDLYMEDLLGIDIFNKLTSPYIGRILVSNFIGHKDSNVLTAINDKMIDIILDKTDNFIHRLPKAILAAKNKFFTAISNELFYDLSQNHPLSDTEFAKFFLNKIEELQPDEIIPNESLTRFTFAFHGNKSPLIFHITTKKEITYYLASSAAETAPDEILTNISTGKYMLCHNEPDDMLPDGRMWPLFIRPAKEFISQNERFFYYISEQNI